MEPIFGCSEAVAYFFTVHKIKWVEQIYMAPKQTETAAAEAAAAAAAFPASNSKLFLPDRFFTKRSLSFSNGRNYSRSIPIFQI